MILLLFKRNGAKANYKDNCRGTTLSPTLCKIYERVLLNRLENYAEQYDLSSFMQFGFKEGIGCTEASFTILETINHILERGSKLYGCSLVAKKLSIPSGLTVCSINYFPNLESEGACGLPSKTFLLGCYIPARCQEHFKFYKVLGRVEYLLFSCTNFTSMVC